MGRSDWLILLEELDSAKRSSAFVVLCHPYAWRDMESARSYVLKTEPYWLKGMGERFLETLDILENDPFSGRKAFHNQGVRILNAEPYLCMFQIRDPEVHLFRVMHYRRQRPERQLTKLAFAKDLSHVPVDLRAEFRSWAGL